MNQRTDSDPHRSQSDRQCCGIYLHHEINRIRIRTELKTNSEQSKRIQSELTVERVAQVDLVPERVTQLDADKLAVPGPLHVLLAVAVRVRVRLEGELSPDGVFSCGDREG